jgi:hypothetical protein
MKCHQFHSFLAAVLTAPLLASCTSVQVRQVDAQLHKFDYLCIKDNPKVMVVDFVSVMEDVFRDHGISSELFYGDPPAHCEYVLTYTARRSWDFVPYLSYAELKIRKGREFVASARYKHNGGSMSWAPNKWDGTRTKMEPVINEMLGRGPSSQSLAQQTDRTSSRTGSPNPLPGVLIGDGAMNGFSSRKNITEEFEINAQPAGARQSPSCSTASILGMKKLHLSDAQIKAACPDPISQSSERMVRVAILPFATSRTGMSETNTAEEEAKHLAALKRQHRASPPFRVGFLSVAGRSTNMTNNAEGDLEEYARDALKKNRLATFVDLSEDSSDLWRGAGLDKEPDIEIVYLVGNSSELDAAYLYWFSCMLVYCPRMEVTAYLIDVRLERVYKRKKAFSDLTYSDIQRLNDALLSEFKKEREASIQSKAKAQ